MSYHFDPITILDTSNASGVGSGGSLTLGGGISIGRDTFIGGNLAISGTATSFSDNILLINHNPTISSDTGLLFQRYTTDITNNQNYSSIIYKESTDEFIFGYIQNNVHKEAAAFNGYTSIKANGLSLESTSNSSRTGGGSLTLLGGANISKDLYVDGKLNLADNIVFSTTGSNRTNMEIDSTQSLYIGSNKAHVIINGNDTTNNPGHIAVSYNNYLSFNYKTDNGNGETELARMTTSGNFGIGSTSPNYKLHVSGDINYTGNLYKDNIILSENKWTHENNVLFYTGGNVGIGTTAPSSLLHVNGQIFCSTVVTSSDERLKTDIDTVDTTMCYSIIKHLPLKTYRWNKEVYNAQINNDSLRLGWIAQDVEKYIPNSVETISAYGLDNCKSINIDQVIACLYGAVQQLIKRNEQLEVDLEKLKAHY